jgi:hypothetical protein
MENENKNSLVTNGNPLIIDVCKNKERKKEKQHNIHTHAYRETN